MQPWRFVVVRDVEQRKRLRVAAMNQAQVEQAPVVIVACGDTEGWKKDLDEVIRIGRHHGFNAESQIAGKRRNVTQDLGSRSVIHESDLSAESDCGADPPGVALRDLCAQETTVASPTRSAGVWAGRSAGRMTGR